MTITISVSTEALIKEVTSLARLRAALSPGEELPEIFNHNHRGSLRNVVKSMFLSVILRSHHNVVNLLPAADGGELMAVEVTPAAGIPGHLARRRIENEVIAATLAACGYPCLT